MKRKFNKKKIGKCYCSRSLHKFPLKPKLHENGSVGLLFDKLTSHLVPEKLTGHAQSPPFGNKLEFAQYKYA